ncbi:MAG: RluA family pseudouridine synthase [Anaerolineales bacterium]
MSDTFHRWTVERGGIRLDLFLSRALPEQSRSSLQRLVELGHVRCNDEPALRKSLIVQAGDRVEVRVPTPPPSRVQPEPIPLEVLFENEDVLVINKPAGLVVHPAAGHLTGTLVAAVLAHAPQMERWGEVQRPGIVHRLDKDTSGIILVAKTEDAQTSLQKAFEQRAVHKVYLALVDGVPPTPEGRIQAAVGRDPSHRQRMAIVPTSRGRQAETVYRTLERLGEHTLLEVVPLTGRTHQIRVHLAFLGCPIVGDRVYGRRTPSLPVQRQLLHAAQLELCLPNERQPRLFIAPMPTDFQQALDGLRGGSPRKPPAQRVAGSP